MVVKLLRLAIYVLSCECPFFAFFADEFIKFAVNSY